MVSAYCKHNIRLIQKKTAYKNEYKLLFHFGEDKTKCILFRRDENLPELNITYNNSNNRIKYSRIAEYHVYCFEANLHEEFTVMKCLWKTTLNLQFLYRQNQFLNPKLCGLLSNSLIQSHFDYASTSWYPLVSQKLSRKIQATQNKCIRFCLKLNSKQHIGAIFINIVIIITIKIIIVSIIIIMVMIIMTGITLITFQIISFVISHSRYVL